MSGDGRGRRSPDHSTALSVAVPEPACVHDVPRNTHNPSARNRRPLLLRRAHRRCAIPPLSHNPQVADRSVCQDMLWARSPLSRTAFICSSAFLISARHAGHGPGLTYRCSDVLSLVVALYAIKVRLPVRPFLPALALIPARNSSRTKPTSTLVTHMVGTEPRSLPR